MYLLFTKLNLLKGPLAKCYQVYWKGVEVGVGLRGVCWVFQKINNHLCCDAGCLTLADESS